MKSLQSCVLILLAVALVLLSGCAYVQTRQKISSLPVINKSSGIGSIRATAWESKDHLYVSGTMRKNFGVHHPHDLRVLVVLADADGQIIETKQDEIPPRSTRRSVSVPNISSFVVKFPLDEIRTAAAVHVILRQGIES